MKKHAKQISLIAFLLAVICVFSGCGIVDFAKSLLVKDSEATSTTAPVSDTTLPPQSTESAVVAPDISAPSTTAPAKNNSTSTSSTAAPSEDESTTAASNGDLSAGQIEETPVKDIQDMLFDTTDPNTAGQILTLCGFDYDADQGIYYSTMNPLQRNFGFNFLYDVAAPRAGMIYSTERILFDYAGKNWMIQLWKGQYGITAGGEIGLYNKTDKIMHYDCANDEELIEMAFDFYNNDQYVFSRGPEKHWWLTGFKIFNVGIPFLIELDITLKFTDVAMANAFEDGLRKVAKNNLLDPITYTRRALTFKIKW